MDSDHKGHYFTYLITAKHCADKLSGGKWFVRVNKKGGGSITVEVAEDLQWATHPTEAEAVDVAVVPWGLPIGADAGYLQDSMFATDEIIADYKMGCGDEVCVTGLFSKLTGTERNQPIIRIGNVAMMPDEPLPEITIGDYCGPATVYLVESRSLGGLSGSPVFIRQSVRLDTTVPERTARGELTGQNLAVYGQSRFFFLGSMHGHWKIRADEHNDVHITSVRSNNESLAIGIAIVIPAKKILEILNQDSFRRGREQANKEQKPSQGATNTE